MSTYNFLNNPTHNEQTHPFLNMERVISALKMLIEKWQLARAVSRERATLRGLSDKALRDIGITRLQANAEANQSFFVIPSDR